MSLHFHPLKIKKIKKETPDCVSVSLEVPKALAAVFEYKEGQSITFKTKINDEEIRRSYSICTAPYESELKVAIKKVDGGRFSSFANNSLKENEMIDVMAPSGKFNAHLTNKNNSNYLAIAAGSGITPIIAIIKHTLHTQPDSNMTLLYGSKNRLGIIFFEELENLKNKYISRFNFINILSQEKTEADINFGRIDANKLSALEPLIDYKKMDAVYCCGPEEMIFTARDFLQKSGVDKKDIHFELFTVPGETKKNQKNNSEESASKGPKSHVTIKVDGRSFSFELANKDQNILDAALKHGADLPYACKGGVCCTCKAKLMSGNVSMDVNYALEEDEISQGFILTCQSHPTTETVIIDFDAR
jgi:ring-1,2-phenylacetyl-CoA epoxidase subunit PaaE